MMMRQHTEQDTQKSNKYMIRGLQVVWPEKYISNYKIPPYTCRWANIKKSEDAKGIRGHENARALLAVGLETGAAFGRAMRDNFK